MRARNIRVEELTRLNTQMQSDIADARRWLGERDSLMQRLETETAQSTALVDNIQRSVRALGPGTTGPMRCCASRERACWCVHRTGMRWCMCWPQDQHRPHSRQRSADRRELHQPPSRGVAGQRPSDRYRGPQQYQWRLRQRSPHHARNPQRWRSGDGGQGALPFRATTPRQPLIARPVASRGQTARTRAVVAADPAAPGAVGPRGPGEHRVLGSARRRFARLCRASPSAKACGCSNCCSRTIRKP